MNQKPSSSIDAQSPWAHRPGPARPVRLHVALAVAPEAAGHARHAAPRMTSSPTRPRTGSPGLVDDVRGGPDARPRERRRLDRPDDVAADDAAADLGPAAVVDDRAAPLADLAEVPPPRLRVPRLAGRAEHAQRRPVVRADGRLAVGHERPDDRRRQAQVGDPMAGHDRPQPVRPREVRARPRRARAGRRAAATRRSPTGPSSSPGR